MGAYTLNHSTRFVIPIRFPSTLDSISRPGLLICFTHPLANVAVSLLLMAPSGDSDSALTWHLLGFRRVSPKQIQIQVQSKPLDTWVAQNPHCLNASLHFSCWLSMGFSDNILLPASGCRTNVSIINQFL